MPSKTPEPEVNPGEGGGTAGVGGFHDFQSGAVDTSGIRPYGNITVGRNHPVEIPRMNAAPKSRQFTAKGGKATSNKLVEYPGGEENGIKFLSGSQALAKMKEATHYSHNQHLASSLSPHLPGNYTNSTGGDFVGTFFGKGVKGDSLGTARYGRFLYKPDLPQEIKTSLFTGAHKIAEGLEVRDLGTASKLLKEHGIIGSTTSRGGVGGSEDYFWAFGMHPGYNLKLHGEVPKSGSAATGQDLSLVKNSDDLGGYRIWGHPNTKLSLEDMQKALDNRPMQEYFSPPTSSTRQSRFRRIVRRD